MKKAILFLLVTLLPTFVMAQKSSDDIYYVPPKKDHEAIKAAKETNNAMLYEQALKALEEQKFILRTDKIEYRHGRSTTAPSYLSVNGEDVYFHKYPFVVNHDERNPNQGLACNFKMKTDDTGSILVTMRIDRIWHKDGKFDIKMEKGSNQCVARIGQVGSDPGYFIYGSIFPLETELK